MDPQNLLPQMEGLNVWKVPLHVPPLDGEPKAAVISSTTSIASPINIPSPPAVSTFSFGSFRGHGRSNNRYVYMMKIACLCLNVQNLYYISISPILFATNFSIFHYNWFFEILEYVGISRNLDSIFEIETSLNQGEPVNLETVNFLIPTHF